MGLVLGIVLLLLLFFFYSWAATVAFRRKVSGEESKQQP
jgi:hypothetical protein